jgi:hypothetical protein
MAKSLLFMTLTLGLLGLLLAASGDKVRCTYV